MSSDQLAFLAVQAGSALAIVGMVAVFAAMGFTASARLTEPRIRAAIQEAAPGAAIAVLHLSEDSAAALASLCDGRVVLVRALGDRVALRMLSASELRTTPSKRGLRVRVDDPGFEPVTLKGVDAFGAPS